MTKNLFPLPATLWEEFFVVDDHDNYPANFMTRIACSGRISRDLFLAALNNCIQSHPLFACRLRVQSRKLFWELDADKDLPVEFVSCDVEPVLPCGKRFDVWTQKLWRVQLVEWKQRGEERTDIIVELHHALCDGLGAIQFISDVAKEIHDLSFAKKGHSQTKLRNADTDQSALARRGQFPQTWREFFRGLPYHYKSVAASLRLIFNKVSPLVPVDSVGDLLGRQKKELGYERIVFSPIESSGLRRTCRKQNTTLNSKVTAEIFRAILEWKNSNGHPATRYLRIMMPFNERGIADMSLPACNRVSLSPFTRSSKEIENESRLLASIESGVRTIKKGRLGLNFHRGLWFCKTFFRSLKMLAKTDRVGATCMFANVGNLHAHLGLPAKNVGVQCGPLTILDVDLVPPVRVGTSFAMTMHEFDGQTRLGIHYDTNMITRCEAADFFGLLKERIRDGMLGTVPIADKSLQK